MFRKYGNGSELSAGHKYMLQAASRCAIIGVRWGQTATVLPLLHKSPTWSSLEALIITANKDLK